jgi:hypothetical protein
MHIATVLRAPSSGRCANSFETIAALLRASWPNLGTPRGQLSDSRGAQPAEPCALSPVACRAICRCSGRWRRSPFCERSGGSVARQARWLDPPALRAFARARLHSAVPTVVGRPRPRRFRGLCPRRTLAPSAAAIIHRLCHLVSLLVRVVPELAERIPCYRIDGCGLPCTFANVGRQNPNPCTPRMPRPGADGSGPLVLDGCFAPDDRARR